MRLCALALLGVLIFAVGCKARRSKAPDGAVTQARAALERTEKDRTRQLLCTDSSGCEQDCALSLPLREYADCLLRSRFDEDPEALTLARQLAAKTGAILGQDPRSSIDGYSGQRVEILPALPLREHRQHLEWLVASFDAIGEFLRSLRAVAPAAVTFEPSPRELRFYKTAERAFPSAYAENGGIGYNLEGALYGNARDVQEVLVHELFHLNDEARGGWSHTTLRPLFDTIVERCGESHECFVPFAPHETIVPNGTYYAFDPRTRDVREYAAELALRYFREHETILAGNPPIDPAFKCLAEENRAAWNELASEFFGGVDLSPECEAAPPAPGGEEET